MGTQIVDPMLFYWISVIDTVRCVLAVIAFIIGCVLAGTIIAMSTECNDLNEFRQTFKKFKGPQIGIFTACLILMTCFMPSGKTLIKMEIAKHATYENTTIVIEKIEEVAKGIIHELKE